MRKKCLSLLALFVGLFLFVRIGNTRDESAPQKTEVYFRIAYSSGDIPSIDTALASESMGIQLIDEMTIGLFRQNERTGELEAGMVEHWEVSPDGLTFTLHLRDGVPWARFNPERERVEPVLDCNGAIRIVSAADFRYAFERTLRPETASPYAFLLSRTIRGAAAYNHGETRDFNAVGVEALDSLTLRVTFLEPDAFNQSLLSLWVTHAMPQWLIEGDACVNGVGARWTETGVYQGYGPFLLRSWEHDDALTIVKNPFWQGTAAVPVSEIDGVTVLMVDEVSAQAEYEAGGLDYALIPTGDFDRIQRDPLYAAQMQYRPVTVGTEALMYNLHLAPTDDIRVRRALTLATDRAALVSTMKAGEAAPFFIPPSAAGAPKNSDAAEFGAVYDPNAARDLIQDYCAEKGITPQDISLTWYYSASTQNKIRAEALAGQWQETLGIQATLSFSDWAVFNALRKDGTYNVYRTAWLQDYLDANNFIADAFFCPGGFYQESTDWPTKDCAASSHEDALYNRFERLVTEARKTQDATKRPRLYAQIEHILINELALINPLNWNYAWVLVSPKFENTPSITGYDRWEKWKIAQ